MKYYKKKLIILAVFAIMFIFRTMIHATEYELHQGKTSLLLDTVSGNLMITLDGTSKYFASSDVFWSFNLFDEDTAKRNDKPLHGQGIYWGNTWSPSHKTITSQNAKLLNVTKVENILTLKYHHELAEVDVRYEIKNRAVFVSGKIKNLGKEPICDFSIMPGLVFALKGNESILIPDQTLQGVEYSKVFSLSWSLTSAWNGFLIRQENNKGFIAFDDIQDIDKEYLISGSSLKGDASGKKITYSVNMRLFVRHGEVRTASCLVMQHYKTLREWADGYVKLCFPHGLPTLREKLHPAQFESLSKAYLAPTYGKINQSEQFIRYMPGKYIIHPPAWMHHVAGNPTNWDVFPNYFPPDPAKGTLEDLEKFVRSVTDSGQFFMPRNSFFYWGENTEFDKRYNLKNNAIIREDGKPRTAKWTHPGYLVSPSAKSVLSELDRIYRKWTTMGANLYFTNVIGAFDPYNNRFDFHPDAPAPDKLYTMLYRLLKRYGKKLPLITEGGGFWQLPYQVGFCHSPGWNKQRPVDAARSDPKRGIMRRAAFEVPLYLNHEYVTFYPTNTSFADGPYSIQRIGFSLIHGFGLKFGINTELQPNRKNILLMRTIALLSDKVQSYLFGARLLDYSFDNNLVAFANYSGNKVIYNPSTESIPFCSDLISGKIAPDGFGFISADHKVTAGVFNSINGQNFDRPFLLVIEQNEDKRFIKIWSPLIDDAMKLFIKGHEIAIPAYPANTLNKSIPGVTLNTITGKTVADPIQGYANLFPNKQRLLGNDTPIPPSNYMGKVPLKLDWQIGHPLPSILRKFKNNLSCEGLRFRPSNKPHIIESKDMVFDSNFYMEVIFCFNQEPENPTRFGEVNIIRAEADNNSIYRRTIELRYHIYMDSLRSLMAGAGYKYAGMTDMTFSFKPGKYYHVILQYDGKIQSLIINGKKVCTSKIPGNVLEKNIPAWLLGDPNADITFQLIRIGG